jgi:hypothetical protein
MYLAVGIRLYKGCYQYSMLFYLIYEQFIFNINIKQNFMWKKKVHDSSNNVYENPNHNT